MSQHSYKFGSFQKYILNINPEGVLLREAHDIMDELRMMRRVYDQQLNVVTDFLKHLQDLHDQENPPNREFLQALQRMFEDLSKDTKAGTAQNLETNTSQRTEQQNGAAPARNRFAGHDERRHEEISLHETGLPEKTLSRAKNLIQEITMRRNELQDYEDTTKDVSNQVCFPSFAFPDLSILLPQIPTLAETD
jgi:hypothetical protein